VAEDGRTPFFNIINKLIEEEFGFVDELKQKLAEAINQQNIDSNEPGKAPQLIKKEDIELTESQQLEVLQIAYQKLVEKVGSLELFHF
jgi:predicted DNA binding protein